MKISLVNLLVFGTVAAIAQAIPAFANEPRHDHHAFIECRRETESKYIDQAKAARAALGKDLESLGASIKTLNQSVRTCVGGNAAASTGLDGCVETTSTATNAALPATITSYATDYAAWIALREQVRAEVKSQCGSTNGSEPAPVPSASPAPVAPTPTPSLIASPPNNG